MQFLNKAVIPIILMVFQNCQDMVQITEQIQVIRLYRFCYAVNDRAGFRTIDTVNQLPCMFMQAKAAVQARLHFCQIQPLSLQKFLFLPNMLAVRYTFTVYLTDT